MNIASVDELGSEDEDSLWYLFRNRGVEPDAKGVYHFALEYLEAAELLKNNVTNGNILAPFYFLVHHAFELFSKAYLMHTGCTYQRLRREFGHDLKALILKCKERRLTVDDQIIKTTETLCELNDKNRRRYPLLGSYVLSHIGFFEPESIVNQVAVFSKKIHEEMNDQN